jgi:hypothetical protein
VRAAWAWSTWRSRKSRCAARKDGKATKEERAKHVQFYADQTMAMLHDAVTKGYKNAAHMKKDTDLDPLRSREDFKKLIAELEATAPKS